MGAPFLEPMLAGWGAPEGDLAAWAAEPKLDGWRVLVTIDDRVTVRTRRGHVLDVPELDSLSDLQLRVVLDGVTARRRHRRLTLVSVGERRAGSSLTRQYCLVSVASEEPAPSGS